MKIHVPEEWLYPINIEAAAETQRLLSERVLLEDGFGEVRYVAGVDVSNNLRDPENWVYAAVVILEYPSLAVVETQTTRVKTEFPYIPGFLGFRETPALIETFRKLTRQPDLIIVDGHGISHPRRFGIASHLGVLLDLPTIGAAKSVLVGKPQGEPGPSPGDSVPLIWKGEQIGTVLRSKLRTNPLYIAPGHRVSMASAVKWVLNCTKGYRLPEPTRQAHQAANVCRRSFGVATPGLFES